MKKLYLMLLAALAACAVSCQENPLYTPAPEEDAQGSRTMTFTATMGPATKAVLGDKDELGKVVTKWENGDGITVFASNGDKAIFNTVLDAPSTTATFTGKVSGKFPAPYTAVYGTMEQESVKFEGNKVIGVEIHPEQAPVENTFDKYVMPAIAFANDADAPLQFKLAATLLKFTMGDEGVNNVTFWGKKNGLEGSVKCSGLGTLSYNGGEPVFEGLDKAYAKVWAGDGKLRKGATYYMVINPDSYDEFTIQFDEIAVRHHTQPYLFKRGHIVNLDVLTREPQQPDTGKRTMTFTAAWDQNESGISSMWEPGDKIRVYDKNGSSFDFTTTVASPAVEAEFSAEIEGEFLPPYSACYGTLTDLWYDNGSIKGVAIPSAQNAREGSFDKVAFPAFARAEEGTSLVFRKLASLIRFTVGEDNVKEVSFKAYAAEGRVAAVSGLGVIDLADADPVLKVDGPEYLIKMTGDFQKGKEYAMVVNPGTLADYTLSINGQVAKVYKKYDGLQDITLTRAQSMDIQTLVSSACPYHFKYSYNKWNEFNFGDCGKYWVLTDIYIPKGEKMVFRYNEEYLKKDIAYKHWFNPTGGDADIEFCEPGMCFDIYVKKDDNRQFCFMPVGGPAPEENITWPDYKGTVTLRVPLRKLGDRNTLHLWIHGGDAVIDGNVHKAEYFQNDGTYGYWTIPVPAEYLGLRAQVIFGKDGLGDGHNQTVNGLPFFIEEDMNFSIDGNNMPCKE